MAVQRGQLFFLRIISMCCALWQGVSPRASKRPIKLLLIRQAPYLEVEKCLSHFPPRETEARSMAAACPGAQQGNNDRSATLPVLAPLPAVSQVLESGWVRVPSQGLLITF